MRLRAWRWLLFLVALVAPRMAHAQSEASRLIRLAREEIDALNVDSAFTILQRALRGAPSSAERVRAFTLLGITQLSRDDRVGARSAFEQALRLDGGLRVDSLTELHTDLRTIFGEVRAALGITDVARESGEAPRLAVSMIVSADTVVPAVGGSLALASTLSYPARAVFSVSPAGAPSQALWTDTTDVSESATSSWSMRGADGVIVAPGRYALRAYASDAAGRVSATIERILIVGRIDVDTLQSPTALGPPAPETLVVNRGSPLRLAAGLFVSAAAVAMPSMLGASELQAGASDPASFAAAAIIGTASLVGFLQGSRLRAMPGNALLNAQARERDSTERARVALENAQRRDAAPIRVRSEGAPR